VSRSIVKWVVVAVLAAAAPARAELLQLADGTIYSSDLGYAFLRDWNTAQTSGYDSDGRMTWQQANAWIDHLNTTTYLGHSDWELGGGFSWEHARLSNFGHLFYSEIQNPPAGGRPVGWTLADFRTGPFVNVRLDPDAEYWVTTEVLSRSCLEPGAFFPCESATFEIEDNTHDSWSSSMLNYATAMRRESVPEPSTLLAVGLGLAGVVLHRRRRRS
jgi:hypothetical protein